MKVRILLLPFLWVCALLAMPAFAQTPIKLSLNTSMITQEKVPDGTNGSNSGAANLVDEQSNAGDPYNNNNGSALSTQWQPSWNSSYYPVGAYINLGQSYNVKVIYLKDVSPSTASNLKVQAGTPGNWTDLFTAPMDDYQGWKRYDLTNITTQYIRFEMAGANSACQEVLIYGIAAVANQPPVVNSGADQILTLPSNSITLNGSASDTDGSIASYSWTKQSGPSATLSGASTASLSLTNLVQGTYTFRLTATDNQGSSAYDEVLVTVNPTNTNNKITLTTSMIVEEKPADGTNPGSSSFATSLIDEQTAAGDPLANAGGMSLNTQWQPSFNASFYPVSAYIDLGQYYKLTNIFLKDVSPSLPANLIVEYGSPGNWQSLFTESMDDWQRWRRRDVDITTRYVRITLTGQNAACGEIVLYGTVYSTLTTANAERNYTQEETILISGVNDRNIATLDSRIDGMPVEEKDVKVTYLDNLGKTEQVVNWQVSPLKKDVVAVAIYDALGRQAKQYLPYTTSTNDATYKADPLTAQSSFYQTLKGDNNASAETRFENSPLSRPLQQGHPGLDWQLIDTGNPGRRITSIYGTNVGNEIRVWNFSTGSNGNFSASSSGFYSANELIMSEVTDEDGRKAREYKDKSGKVVSKKAQKTIGNANSFIETQYVYDDFGNLRFVISPEALALLASSGYTVTWNDDFCKTWLFAYKYDDRFRLTEKIVPGGGITFIVYDPLDRVIMTQDVADRGENRWFYTKYDVLGRNILSGKYTPTCSVQYPDDPDMCNFQPYMQQQVDDYYAAHPTYNYYEQRTNTNYSSQHGYTNQSFPATNTYTLAASYYDDYDFDYNGVEYEGGYAFVNMGNGFASAPFRARGMATGSKTAMLGTDDYPVWLWTVSYYDSEGRVIQVQQDVYLSQGGSITDRDIASTQYDFSGKVIKTEHRHRINGGANMLTTKRRYAYDHAGRKKEVYMQLNTESEEKIAQYGYNELGEMTRKILGNNLQTVDYAYNIRGWLMGINPQGVSTDNTRVFSMGLQYFTPNSPSDGYYNGNIWRMTWEAKNSKEFARRYQYTYDGLNRLTRGWYDSSRWETSGGNTYVAPGREKFEVNMSYTDNGNISTLSRENLLSKSPNAINTYGMVDNLTYQYAGNQLAWVDDAITANSPANDFSELSKVSQNPQEYIYDYAGKLTKDYNKGIGNVIYNELDLPTNVISQYNAQSYMQNNYDASGEKLSARYYINGSIEKDVNYIGGLQYENGILQFVNHEEGRAIPPQVTGKTIWTFEYHYYDHLGSLRAAVRQGDNYTHINGLESNPNVSWSNSDIPIRNQERVYTGNWSAKLNNNNPLGPWKTIKVGKGDKITVKASANYTRANGQTFSNTAVNLIPFVNALPAQSVESKNSPVRLGAGLAIVPLLMNGINFSSAVPKAYLQYVMTNEKDNTVTETKRQYISALANTVTIGGGWENLQMTYTAESDGFFQILTANESDVDVWFDDISVQVEEALIVQETHYDPWGVELAGIENRGNPESEYKFQGKELIDDAFLGQALYWMDFGARYYDPQLGRWQVTDPADQFSSPYTGMGDNPIMMYDPDGRFAWVAPIIAGAIVGIMDGGMKALSNNGQYSVAGGMWRGGLVGAVGGALASIGGGTLIGNIAWGAAEGAFTGGLNSVLWNENVGKGMLKGAAIGGLFAGATSGIEAYRNYKDGYGFHTNEGVLNKFIKEYSKTQYSYNPETMTIGINEKLEAEVTAKTYKFIQKRYGLNGIDFKYVNTENSPIKYDGYTSTLVGDPLLISNSAFLNPSSLKSAMVHEYGHELFDRIHDKRWSGLGRRGFITNFKDQTLQIDGGRGYAQEIMNAGKLHINPSLIIKENPLWKEWRGLDKWFYLLPKRLDTSLTFFNYP